MTDYFAFYGIEKAFHIDEKDLRKKYLNISRENHPDFFGGDASAQSRAMEITTQNNKAYKVLSDQILRSRHLLDLLGHAITEKDKVPGAFLMGMMEFNERIMDASVDENLRQSVVQDYEKLSEELNNCFSNLTKQYDEQPDESVLQAIRNILLQQKYLLRIKESLDKFAPL